MTLIDPNLEWTFDKSRSLSLSHNTPFDKYEWKGRAVATIVSGQIVWQAGK